MIMAFTFRRKCIAGTKLARKIGFPTLNFRTHRMNVRKGVYAGFVILGKHTFPAVSYYGPKFGCDTLTLETHILDTKAQKYIPKKDAIEVQCSHFIRGPMNFKSAEELRVQIGKDVEEAEKVVRSLGY